MAIEYRAVWSPLPGSQSLAISCPCDEILYEGTRGPGKTAAQLARFRRNVGIGYGSYWRGVIFDVEYKNLADIITQSKRMFKPFQDGSRYLSSASELRWVWPTGEELLFRFGQDEDDYWDYHGQEFPFIGFNELTKQRTNAFYEAMFSCRRSSFLPHLHPLDDGTLLPPIPLETFSTTNPFGPGHSWVKARFIDPAPRGTVIRDKQVVFNPQTKRDEEITLTRVAIHGSYRENPYLDPVYVATLENITNPARRKAWLEGDWDIPAGGAIEDVWDTDVHVMRPFDIPENWTITRSFDWGSSHPFSVGWWAISDGTPLPDGRRFPRKTQFRIAEMYGWNGKANEGCRMLSSDVAAEIKRREAEYFPKRHVVPGPADNAIWNQDDGRSIADSMAEKGVVWTRSDKSRGSRKLGLEELRRLLQNAKDNTGPGLYVFDVCKHWIRTVPTLPRDSKDPDDVDSMSEDHAYDDTRYQILNKSAVQDWDWS